MFYGQCNACGERWGLGTVSTCKCPDLVTWDASAPLVVTPHPAFKKPWVGLTQEEIEQGKKESWVSEQAFESAVWWAEAKLREKNCG
jgi:hypothetical protein